MDVKQLHKADDQLAPDGPDADGDPMGTPAADEAVLWTGRPSLPVLARSAFHTRTVGLYFVALIVIAIMIGNTNAAIVCALLAIVAVSILHGLAWLSARSTLYILTDTRLIMRIGMAIETRINIPLKHILSADLKLRGGDHGDLALTIGGERLLGYALLWPHARPWRFTKPEPMLRAVPDAERVAALLAQGCAAIVPIERAVVETVAPVEAARKPGGAPAQAGPINTAGLKGAPA